MNGEATKEHTSMVPENLNCAHAGRNDDIFVHKCAHFLTSY